MKRGMNNRNCKLAGEEGAGEAGQALLEMALVMPLFALLLVGAAELARVAFAAIEVANAARAGAQYGAQSPFYSQDTTGITNAAENDANDIYAIKPTNFSVTSAISYICSDGTATVSSPPSCSSSTATVEQILTVNTQGTFDPLFHIQGMASSFTLRGQAIQKVLIQ
jgi:Flp pilus assembly protein TadG